LEGLYFNFQNYEGEGKITFPCLCVSSFPIYMSPLQGHARVQPQKIK